MHEKSARQYYISNIRLKHHDIQLQESGLVIDPKWGYIGATPDGKVESQCCGKGIIEIKCPYCQQGRSIESAVLDKGFCLQKNSDGKVHLDKKNMHIFIRFRRSCLCVMSSFMISSCVHFQVVRTTLTCI